MNTLLITNPACYDQAKNYLRSMQNLAGTIYYPYDFFECQLKEIQKMKTMASKNQAMIRWNERKLEETKKMIQWDEIEQFIFFFPFGFELTDNDLEEIRCAISVNKPFFDLFVRDEIRDLVYNDVETKNSVFVKKRK